MKLLIILALWFSTPTDCAEMSDIRTKFHQFENSNELKDYMRLFDGNRCSQSRPYEASAIMQQAEFTINPIKKLGFFNEGKDILEAYIQSNPKDVEARYVRIQVQFHSPEFLGYRDSLRSDISYVLKHIEASKLPLNYRKQIIKNIKHITQNL